MTTPCTRCEGRGIYPRWTRSAAEEKANGLCEQCGGRGHDGPLAGWLCGPHKWPDTSAPSRSGQRLALIMTRDGCHPDLPGTFWRVRLALTRPYVNDGRVVGSRKRWGRDSKGKELGGTLMATDVNVSGALGLESDRRRLEELGDTFDGCIQIAGEFPRMSWRGTWKVSRDITRVVLTGDGYMLDKVH